MMTNHKNGIASMDGIFGRKESVCRATSFYLGAYFIDHTIFHDQSYMFTVISKHREIFERAPVNNQLVGISALLFKHLIRKSL
jgi:hypothetical protein